MHQRPYPTDAPAQARLLRHVVGRWHGIRGVPRLAYLTRGLMLRGRDHMCLVDTPEGTPVTIDPRDYGQVMQFYFPYSPELRNLLSDVLLPDDRCVDLGANTGILAAAMAIAVGPGGAVLAVDPNPMNIRLIEHTVTRCGLAHLVPLHAAVAGRRGTARFAIPSGATSESGDIRHDRAEGLEVRMMPVAELVAEAMPGCAVDFIKCDVEGAEAELIEALDGLLADGQRPGLLVEYHPDKIAEWGADPQVIRQALWDLGYEERHVEAEADRYRLRADRRPLATRANLLYMQPDALVARDRIRAHW